MSYPPPDARTNPSGTKAAVSFVVGLLVGAGLGFPLLPSVLDLLVAGESLGSIGKTLVVGVLLLVLVVVGFMTLFRIFVLIDR